MSKIGYLHAEGIDYRGTLHKLKKSADQLTPLYEAFTNSLEAIKAIKKEGHNGHIKVVLSKRSTLVEDTYEFESLQIEDNGSGFTEDDFTRMKNLNDSSKGFNNKGTGRIQLLLFFQENEYESIYYDNILECWQQRTFMLSQNEDFLKKNAIVRYDNCHPIENIETSGTILTMRRSLDQKTNKYFAEIDINELRRFITTHYMIYFCKHKDSLPIIELCISVDGTITKHTTITSSDVPSITRESKYAVHYTRAVVDHGKVQLKPTAKSEIFYITAFKIKASDLARNGAMFVSKEEVVESIPLGLLSSDDKIEDYRYLFFIEGQYLDSNVDETRGNLLLHTKSELRQLAKASPLLYEDNEDNEGIIVVDDITQKAKEQISSMFSEINDKISEQENYIQLLRRRFLLSQESIQKVRHHIRVTDTSREILTKVYRVCSAETASTDAIINQEIETLESMNPASKEYFERLHKTMVTISHAVPIQNRNSLTQYVARRKIVLELFRKILNQELTIQQTQNRKQNEKLLHNLLFQQCSSNPEDSDLWILNEDFIYFGGTSDIQIEDVKVHGESLIKKDFTEEEQKHLNSLNEKRLEKRPDVLLFPDEGKCIIIEFKAPEVNIAKHLDQIKSYANLIRNYSNDKFQLTGFYGYLIGEGLDPYDIRSYDADFKEAYNFDYMFSTQRVAGFHGRSDGTLYMEVIKYSTLLKRAITRNDIFISKITGHDNET